MFKKFKVMVKKETGGHIKAVRSDRGAEYTSRLSWSTARSKALGDF